LGFCFIVGFVVFFLLVVLFVCGVFGAVGGTLRNYAPI
jgi:hypothetical protein